MSNSSSTPIATFSRQWKYDVFLNFRGGDTREKFLSHLREALYRAKLVTFFDENLLRGKEISPALLKAIEESHVAVTIFSRDYASSPWCLEELVKIIECYQYRGQIVIPVFYDVSSSVVLEQSGIYAEAFAKHERDSENARNVPNWKAAMTKVANLSGRSARNTRPESKLVNEIVNDILISLGRTSDGMDFMVETGSGVQKPWSVKLSHVRTVEVQGMGGLMMYKSEELPLENLVSLLEPLQKRLSQASLENSNAESGYRHTSPLKLWDYSEKSKNTGSASSSVHISSLPENSESDVCRRESKKKPAGKSFTMSNPSSESQLESIPVIVREVWSDDPQLQLEAATQFRKLLSIGHSSHIDEVVKAGVVPRFVEFLQHPDLPQLQFEAAWTLTNVASGTSEHTQVVIEHGAVPVFVRLLSSASDDIREQAVWALGNIAGDSPSCRDLVLGHGALMPLLALLNERSKLSMLRNATWTLSNLCRGKPPTPFDQVKPALPILWKLIHLSDEEVLTDACWALTHLSDGTIDKIQAVIEAGVCQRLVELLLHPSDTVLIPSLRTVGNIATGGDAQTQSVIDNQALPCLYKVLTQNHKTSIKKEACWTISNVTAGNRVQIQAVIEADIILPLMHLLRHGEFEIKKEAAWAISNVTAGGSHEQIRFLVSHGCIKPLCDLLVSPDPSIVTVCLESLENILKVGEADKEMGMNSGVNLYANMIDECGGLCKIENLQTHSNEETYEKAVKILERYWVEENKGQNVQHGGFRNQQVFGFGNNRPNFPMAGSKFVLGCTETKTSIRIRQTRARRYRNPEKIGTRI